MSSRVRNENQKLTGNPVDGSERSQDPNSSNGRQVYIPHIQHVFRGPVSQQNESSMLDMNNKPTLQSR